MSGIAYLYAGQARAEIVVARDKERRYPPHVHARHRVFGFVLAGRVTLCREGEEHTFAAKGFFAVAPGVTHSLHIENGAMLVSVCVAALPGWPDALFDAVARLPVAYRPDEKTVAAAVCAGQVTPEGDAAPSVAAVVDRVMNQPGESFSLEEMAALAGYSPWHFLRLFREATGMTPHAFHLACRVGYARRLLREGAPPAEAAAGAGFADQSHMYKAFGVHHGMTPGRFLRLSSPLPG